MRTTITAAALAGALGLTASASGGGVSQAPVPAPAPAQTAQPSPPPADGQLPVSLGRIRRQLRERSVVEVEQFDDFRLLTSLHVYGQSPRFELFSPEGGPVSSTGPIRYGGMTHQEFLQQVTPRNFQAPVMNLSGGLFSLGSWISDKRRESQRRRETEARQQPK